jgi:hypothetical protein
MPPPPVFGPTFKLDLQGYYIAVLSPERMDDSQVHYAAETDCIPFSATYSNIACGLGFEEQAI